MPSLGFSRQEHWSGLPFPSCYHLLIISYEAGNKIYFIYLDTSHYLFLPYLYRWFCPCKESKVFVAQLYPTLCNPVDYNPPGSSVYGSLQARILELVTLSFSRKSSQPRGWTRVSCMAGRFFTVWAIREALCSCNPPDKSQWNWHLWGWDIGRVDCEVLKSGVRRVPRSLVCLHTGCTSLYVYRPPPLFHFSCFACAHPHSFSGWWLALEDKEANSTFSFTNPLQSVRVTWLGNGVLGHFCFWKWETKEWEAGKTDIRKVSITGEIV